MQPSSYERNTAHVLVDGVQVNYHTAGIEDSRQPVLVMVHGSAGSTDSHYGYLFPMLAFRQRVVSIDLAPPADAGPLALDALVAQLGAVIDRVGNGQPVSLMGYSLGAVVAAAFAARRAQDVRNLVLVAGWQKTDAHQRLRNGIWRELRRTDSQAIRNYMLFCAHSPAFIVARTPEELAGMAGKIALNDFVDRQMDLNSRIDIADEVPNIRAATLVVGCTHDRMVPYTHAQQLFGAIDDARYTQIDAGHGVVFERPAELLRLVDTFLRHPAAYAAGSIIPAAQP